MSRLLFYFTSSLLPFWPPIRLSVHFFLVFFVSLFRFFPSSLVSFITAFPSLYVVYSLHSLHHFTSFSQLYYRSSPPFFTYASSFFHYPISLPRPYCDSIPQNLCAKYKVVQIWPGQTVTCLHTISPGHIWTTLYLLLTPCNWQCGKVHLRGNNPNKSELRSELEFCGTS